LHTIGLFPLGSCVMLSDQRVGKVIRGNGIVYDRPVLEVWRRSDLEARPVIVNLATEPDLKVVRAVSRLM
jgi:hypothetical protein